MRKLLLLLVTVFGGITLAPTQSQAGVHIGFAVVSPLCYTPPIYIGPTFSFAPGPTVYIGQRPIIPRLGLLRLVRTGTIIILGTLTGGTTGIRPKL
jgi:hypothetical protein